MREDRFLAKCTWTRPSSGSVILVHSGSKTSESLLFYRKREILANSWMIGWPDHSRYDVVREPV